MELEPLRIPAKCDFVIPIKSDDYEFVDGDIIYMTIKPKFDNDDTDSEALLKKSWTVGTDATYDVEEYLDLPLTPTDTDIDFGCYVFDLKLETTTGKKDPLYVGKVHIMPMVTLEH